MVDDRYIGAVSQGKNDQAGEGRSAQISKADGRCAGLASILLYQGSPYPEEDSFYHARELPYG